MATDGTIVMRILRFPLVRLGILYGVLTYLHLSGFFFRGAFTHGPLQGLAASAMACLMMLVVYVAFVRGIEGRQADELALRPMPREFVGGLLLGAGLFTACILALMAAGAYRIEGVNAPAVLLVGLAGALATGVYEELLFRAGVFRIAQEWIGSWGAIILSSLVFGYVHMGNEAATTQGIVSISIWAGLLLTATYLMTGRLWLGIGLHAAWNYTQGTVYGGSVSGNGIPDGWVRPVLTGPDWLTGGAFGIEASPAALVICTAAAVIMLAVARRRGNIVPPVWRRVD